MVATGIIILCYIFLQFIIVPKAKEIGSLNAKLSSQRQDLKTAKAKESLLKSLEEGTLQKQRLGKTKEEQTIEALQLISKSIATLDLDLVSIRPHPEEVIVETARAILFDVTFIGSYNSIYKFMDELEKLPILILIDSIELKRADKGAVSTSIVLSVYY